MGAIWDGITNFVGNTWNAINGTKQSQSFSSAEAEKQRNWEQYMSSTAHQREIEDLKAAGLNPVLSAMGSSGASTPSGASASSNGGGGLTGILTGLSSIIHSAAQYKAVGGTKEITDHFIDAKTGELMNAAVRTIKKLK